MSFAACHEEGNGKAWAFFLEAIFIGTYLYGWDRLRPRLHLLLGAIIVPVAFLGAFGVITANSWMNTPNGFQLGPDGRPVNVDVTAAIFTHALGYEFWHFMIAAYMTAAFMVASVYAVGWLRGRRDHYYRLGFTVPFTVGALVTPVQLFVGDISARALTQDQPAKFAAVELAWQTRSHNPEILGGVMTGDGQVVGGLQIPWFDSLLVGYSPDAVVRGLSTFAANNRPTMVEANIVHFSFNVMVGLGSAGFLLALWYWWAWLRHRDLPGIAPRDATADNHDRPPVGTVRHRIHHCR